MGKYTKFLFDGKALYFTMKDLKEPFHAHISNKQLAEKGSAKLFIRKDGSCIVVDKGKIKDQTISKVIEYIKNNYLKMFEDWKNKGGKPEFYIG